MKRYFIAKREDSDSTVAVNLKKVGYDTFEEAVEAAKAIFTGPHYRQLVSVSIFKLEATVGYIEPPLKVERFDDPSS
jgi:hypothetical protein